MDAKNFTVIWINTITTSQDFTLHVDKTTQAKLFEIIFSDGHFDFYLFSVMILFIIIFACCCKLYVKDIPEDDSLDDNFNR